MFKINFIDSKKKLAECLKLLNVRKGRWKLVAERARLLRRVEFRQHSSLVASRISHLRQSLCVFGAGAMEGDPCACTLSIPSFGGNGEKKATPRLTFPNYFNYFSRFAGCAPLVQCHLS